MSDTGAMPLHADGRYQRADRLPNTGELRALFVYIAKSVRVCKLVDRLCMCRLRLTRLLLWASAGLKTACVSALLYFRPFLNMTPAMVKTSTQSDATHLCTALYILVTAGTAWVGLAMVPWPVTVLISQESALWLALNACRVECGCAQPCCCS